MTKCKFISKYICKLQKNANHDNKGYLQILYTQVTSHIFITHIFKLIFPKHRETLISSSSYLFDSQTNHFIASGINS